MKFHGYEIIRNDNHTMVAGFAFRKEDILPMLRETQPNILPLTAETLTRIDNGHTEIIDDEEGSGFHQIRASALDVPDYLFENRVRQMRSPEVEALGLIAAHPEVTDEQIAEAHLNFSRCDDDGDIGFDEYCAQHHPNLGIVRLFVTEVQVEHDRI